MYFGKMTESHTFKAVTLDREVILQILAKAIIHPLPLKYWKPRS